MKSVKVWFGGLIKEESAKELEGSKTVVVTRYKVLGFSVYKRVIMEIDREEPAPAPLSEQAQKIKDRAEAVQGIEGYLATKLPVTIAWLDRHYRGHITNALREGLPVHHIEHMIFKMASKKIRRDKARNRVSA